MSLSQRIGASFGKMDLALLLLRLGIGTSVFLFHGLDKISSGPQRWTRLGEQMQHLGVTFAPLFWGLMASLAESLGSVLIVLGLFFRPAAAALACTMAVAMVRHLNLPPGTDNSGWSGASHALELFTVYVAFLIAGSGRYALGRRRRTAP